MKIRILILIIIGILFLSCNENPNKSKPEKTGKNQNNWQEGFGLTHNIDKDSIWNKPVRFYVENKNCNQTAKDFYFGKYRPIDEPKTAELLMLVTTENSELRPFYGWILNKTILIQDGALGEYTGVPARKYAEKYPKEFFEYMDYDKTGKKYSDWYNSILYSGFYDYDDWKDSKKVRTQLIKTMTQNCKECDDNYKNRIKKFADDCFPDNEK